MELKCQNLEPGSELNELFKPDDSSTRSSRCLLIPSNPVAGSSSGGENSSSFRLAELNNDEFIYSDDIFEEADDGNDESKMDEQSDEGSHIFNISMTPKREVSQTLQEELSKYKQELRDYTNTTKSLEKKCLKINHELNEIQKNHENFVSKHNLASADTESCSEPSSTSSVFSLKRKYTQVFHRGSSFQHGMSPRCSGNSSSIEMQETLSSSEAQTPCRKDPKAFENRQRNKSCSRGKKENIPPKNYEKCRGNSLRSICKVLKSVIDIGENEQLAPQKGHNFESLQSTIRDLRSERKQFRTIIEQQQHSLEDYHTRCIKAQHIMKSQYMELQKLHSSNLQLENVINESIEQLRQKIELKLREVAQMPNLVREEQLKSERALKENSLLNERIRAIQAEASSLKMKLDEITRRKSSTLTRLKTSERDLKIFKNYNASLKHEKRKLTEELEKMREQLNAMQNSSKRNLNRQREQNEKQRRDLQKRVFELEMKLNRAQSSTASLVQERDNLITELQTQLNTLVHNFEVSQKHIRVLRRHIYNMSSVGVNARETVAVKRILDATAANP